MRADSRGSGFLRRLSLGVGGWGLLIALAGAYMGLGCGLECMSDGECPGSQTCSPHGFCVQGCMNDSDCPQEEFCDQDEMVCKERCKQGVTADGTVCDPETGETVLECDDPMANPCAADKVCQSTTGECVDNPCGPGTCPDGSACQPMTGLCEVIPCTMAVDCPLHPEQQCLNGKCEDLCEPGGCPDNMFCDPNGMCADDAFLTDCESDDDCTLHQKCVDNGGDGNVCMAKCRDEGSAYGQKCEEDFATVPENCATDADCDGDRLCDGGRGICADALPPEGCPAGTTLVTGDRCIQDDCATDADCNSGVCDLATTGCMAQCFRDGCAPGLSCDLMTGTCQPDPPFAGNAAPTIANGDADVGASTPFSVGFAAAAGEAQLWFLQAILPAGLSVATFPTAGTSIGSASLDQGGGPAPVADVVSAGPRSACVDLDGDGICNHGSDVTMRVRVEGVETFLTFVVPRGGDGDPSEHLVEPAAAGDWSIDLDAGIVTAADGGLHEVRLEARSVDDTGGPSNGRPPGPVVVFLRERIPACDVTYDGGPTGDATDFHVNANWEGDAGYGTTDFVCCLGGAYSELLVSTAETVGGVYAVAPFRITGDLTTDGDSEFPGGLTLESGNISSNGKLFIEGSLTTSGTSTLDVAAIVLEAGTTNDIADDTTWNADTGVATRGDTSYHANAALVGGSAFATGPGGSTTIDAPGVDWEMPLHFDAGSTGTILSPGTFQFSKNHGALTIDSPVADGPVDLVSFLPGEHKGSIDVTPGSEATITAFWDIGGAVTGGGVVVSAGESRFRQPLVVDDLSTANSGVLRIDQASTTGAFACTNFGQQLIGDGDLTVNGVATIQNCSLEGQGGITLNGPATVQSSTFNARDLDVIATFGPQLDVTMQDADLRIHDTATATFGDGAAVRMHDGTYLNDGTVVVNPVSNFAFVTRLSGVLPVWIQSGTGSTTVNADEFRIYGDAQHAGSYTIAPGAWLWLLTATHQLNQPTLTVDGTLYVVDATLRMDGVQTIGGTGDTQFTNQATTVFRIDGTSPGYPGGHDQLAVQTSLTLSGTLAAELGAYAPQVGDTFDVLTFPSKTGSFTATALPPLALGRDWQVNDNPTTVQLEVVAADQALAIDVVPLDDEVEVGERAAFDLTFTSTGSDGFADLYAEIDVAGPPVDIEYVAPSSGSCTSVSPITCNFGAVAPGSGRTLRVVLAPHERGTVTLSGLGQLVEPFSGSVEVRSPGTLPPADPYGTGGNGTFLVPGGLYAIDPGDGTFTFVTDMVSPGGVNGYVIEESGDVAWGNTISGFGSTSKLLKIDPATGAVLQTVGDITVGGVAISIGDLAIQPGTGVLYALRSNADGQGMAGQIMTVDKATGVATVIGPVSGGRSGAIAFTADGRFYQTTNNNTLRRLDPVDASTINEVSVSRFYDGLGYRERGDKLWATSFLIWLIDPDTGDEVSLQPGEANGIVNDLAFRLGPVKPYLRFSDSTTAVWDDTARAASYDVVRGDLDALRQNGGDFSLSLTACAYDDRASADATIADMPGPGQTYYWLVRAGVTDGPGSYDSRGPVQVAPRDAGIAASGNDCP